MNSVARFAVLWAVLLFFAGCSSQEDTSPDSAERSQIKIEELEYSLLPTGERILTGSLRNESKKPISGAQVQVSLFDNTNRKVGSMSFVVRNVGPGEQKPFRQPVNEANNVHGARVRSVIVL